MRPLLMLLGVSNSSVLDNPIEYEAGWVRRTYWPLEVRRAFVERLCGQHICTGRAKQCATCYCCHRRRRGRPCRYCAATPAWAVQPDTSPNQVLLLSHAAVLQPSDGLPCASIARCCNIINLPL